LNPLVKNYLLQIADATAELGEILAERQETITNQQAARDALQQQVWSRSKEIAVLQEAASDYNDLKRANEGHREREVALAEGLRKVLAYTRALTEEVRR
jgi:hypothetical protein